VKALLGSLFDFALFFGTCWLIGRIGAIPSNIPPAQATVIFLFAIFALTTIITSSWIAQPIVEAVSRIPIIGPGLYSRDEEGNDHGLLSCPLCTGMWSGLALAAFGVAMYPIVGMQDLATHGLVGAGWSFLLAHVIERLERQSPPPKDKS